MRREQARKRLQFTGTNCRNWSAISMPGDWRQRTLTLRRSRSNAEC